MTTEEKIIDPEYREKYIKHSRGMKFTEAEIKRNEYFIRKYCPNVIMNEENNIKPKTNKLF